MGSFGNVLIIDNDVGRRSRLEAILSFMQLPWRSLHEAEGLAWLNRQKGSVTVLIGGCSAGLFEALARLPQHSFITLEPCGIAAANLIGQLEPLTYHELTGLLQQARRRLCEPSPQEQGAPLHQLLIGRCPAMLEVKSLIQQVANKQANVLLLGESGTGKEVIARAIHLLSTRAEHPFVPINCGAIPAELLESELFGHEKGAFTGAISSRKGRFELAEGGTLFLDEIGDMPLPMQVKLLRVLQERTFERVGGTRPIQANVRIIAATHRDLEAMIVEQKFREDLYYRLNVFPIQAPPLRERKEDIPLLLNELVQRHRRVHQAELHFADDAVRSLQSYHWPGNVRELSNLVERMFILRPNQLVETGHLPEKYRHPGMQRRQTGRCEEQDERDALSALFHQPEAARDEDEPVFDFSMDEAGPDPACVAPSLPSEGINLKEMLAGIEIDLIAQALDANEGVVARAADQLGMRRTTLVEKMKKYGIGREF